MANGSSKRARKKTHRDERVTQHLAAYRRRRMVRWTAGALVVALIVGGGLILAGGGDDRSNGGNDRAATGSDPDAATTPTAPSEQAPPEVPTAAACGGQAPASADPKTDYPQPGDATEEGVDYGAVIETSCGVITVDLLEESAPETVNNFVFLAKEGYFDGLIFHRVEPGFVVQAGDPNGLNGTPPDGPGYTIPDELPAGSKDYVFGALAMANAGPDTGGSQFFFVVSEAAAGLQPDYAIFGRASSDSKKTLLEIANQKRFGGTDPVRASMPTKSVYIQSIEITKNQGA